MMNALNIRTVATDCGFGCGVITNAKILIL